MKSNSESEALLFTQFYVACILFFPYIKWIDGQPTINIKTFYELFIKHMFYEKIVFFELEKNNPRS